MDDTANPYNLAIVRAVVSALLWIGSLLCHSLSSPALADEAAHHLQGVFCNSERQIDEVVGYLAVNHPERSAVALVNRDGVVCNYVDLIQYVVERPTVLGVIPGVVPLVKYKADLVEVLVGGVPRKMTPPATVFFVAPRLLTGASAENRV